MKEKNYYFFLFKKAKDKSVKYLGFKKKKEQLWKEGKGELGKKKEEFSPFFSLFLQNSFFFSFSVILQIFFYIFVTHKNGSCALSKNTSVNNSKIPGPDRDTNPEKNRACYFLCQ